ncbi:transglycosylase domain-containing protein [uncultured Serinicoccus sp.]|uniref:transglycosylase domain-containing protein n=1 Tax=uncultured Serinicoccus sp. TaxID=735514 RepID=UPI0026142E7A|nr:transglycosylase domain-containing protein [uncultured Serinicoccus sp.]
MRSALTVARVTSLLGVFLAVSILMGIIGAGLLAPVVGATGLAARESVSMFEELPGDLEQNPLAQQSRILAADGTILATPATQNRIIVESDEISQNMKDAQVAIEDARFFQHGGADVEALARAVVQNSTTETTQGGSTLTQQYIKLALQDQALKEGDAEAYAQTQARSGMEGYVRKLRELKYAITLEERLSKDEILVGYLNLAFYGDRVYGVEAAARHYFNVNAKDLTVAQSALLAGVVRSPSNTNPVVNPELAQARRDVVLGNMFDQGMITEEELEEAKAQVVGTGEGEMLEIRDSQRSCLRSANPYFCDYVEAWLLEQPALGKTRDERLENLTTNGLTVQTTLDLELSAEIKDILRDATPEGNEYFLGSAASVVEPGTGKILAFNQSSQYDLEGTSDKVRETSVNWNVDNAYGGPGGMAIGSIAKAYTLVEAMEKGVPVEADIRVREPEDSTFGNVWLEDPENRPTSYPPSDEVFPAGIFFRDDFEQGCTIGEDHWAVRNANDENHVDEITLRKAAALSVNTAFATLASQVGTCDIAETMTEMGLHAANGQDYGLDPGNAETTLAPSLVLGADTASPLTVASSYATFASGGIYCPPVPVTKVLDADGEELPLELPECERVIEEDVALGAVELLEGVLSIEGSGWQAILDDDRPAGGKTGTNNDSTATWFAGFTPQLSTAVFVGNVPAGARYDGDLVDITIGGEYIEGPLFGSSLAAPTWKRIMETASQGMDVQEWDEPSNEILNGKRVTIPRVVGLEVGEAQERLEDAGLTGAVVRVGSDRPEGTVVYTTPGVGSSVQTSDPVTLHVSSGFQQAAAPPPAPARAAPRQSQPQPPPQPQPQPTEDAEPEPTQEPEPEPEPEPTQAPEPAPAPTPDPSEEPPGTDPPGDDEDDD